ncbi:programmed cell death protein 2-like [Sinocyclocheilus anshuiensis]|nr:PREDICTED: programmed cell death protein 2-like [Sinocyclocheilus anshuiensis]
MATSIHETVLIGICDGVIDKKKNTSYCTNKIGDRPDLLPTIPLQCPICSLCQRGLSHVVQVYCPLAASPYHRTISVFACTNPQCSGKSESWIVLRSQCLEDDIKARQDNKTTACTESAMSRTDWCDEADDWGMDDEEQEKAAERDVQMPNDSIGEGNDVSRRLQDLCIDGDHQSALQPTDVPLFQPFYMSVMEETDLDGFLDTDHENELLRAYEEREGVLVAEIQSCESGGATQEEYEKATAKHGDEVFISFMKKISLCPEQVLR